MVDLRHEYSRPMEMLGAIHIWLVLVFGIGAYLYYAIRYYLQPVTDTYLMHFIFGVYVLVEGDTKRKVKGLRV